MDTLNRIFDIATEEGSLSPLKGRQARLRLSLYADDAVIFTNPKREDINGIMQIMEPSGMLLDSGLIWRKAQWPLSGVTRWILMML
jgi:hypothetical protein